MARQRYTLEQLLRLRDSPLVKKPDGLPSIEQWFESAPADPNQRKTRLQSLKVDDQHLAHENHAPRPSLFQTRHLTRNSSTAPEDIVLGPPKTSFASASANRNLVRQAETSDRSSLPRTDEDGTRQERVNMRDKFFRDRDKGDKDADRQRERPGNNNGRRGGRDDHNGWTSGRPRRSFGQEETERPQRGFNREKDRSMKERARQESADGLEADETMNGEPKGRAEGRWTRQSNPAWAHHEVEDKQEAVRDRGWRDRDRQGDRNWTRGDRNERVEREPEWMDDPAPEARAQAHTQEDFQRWKEQMRASGGQAEARTGRSEETPLPAKEEPAPPKKAESSMLPADLNKLFGQWGEVKQTENAATQGGLTPARSQNSKPKSSRYTAIWAPKEDPVPKQPEPPAVPVSAAPSPGGLPEDKEGFQRILQMLGGVTISSKSPKQEGASSQHSRPLSMDASNNNPLANLFLPGQAPAMGPSEGMRQERSGQSDQYADLISPRSNDAFAHGFLHAHGQLPGEGDQRPLGEEARPQLGQPQGREGTQVLPRPVERITALSRDSEFLLKLMQQPRLPSNEPRATQHTPRQPPDPNFSIFLDDKPPKVPRQPQQPQKPPQVTPRMPPPGFADDLNFGLGRRQPDTAQDQLSRQGYPRPPPGLFDDPALQHKVRRHPTDEPPRYSQAQGTLVQPSPSDNFNPFRTNPPQSQEHNIAPPPGLIFAGRNTNIPPGLGGFPEHLAFNHTQRPPPPLGNPRVGLNVLASGHAAPPPPPPPGFGHQQLPPGFPPGIYPQEGGAMRRSVPQYELFHAGQGMNTADMGRPVGRGMLNPPMHGYTKKAGPGGAAWDGTGFGY